MRAGRLIAFEGVMTDVTARKKMEQELADSQVLLRAAIENSPDAVIVVDQESRIIAFNRHFVEMWKIPQELTAGDNNAPILKFVASCMKNESGFLERVRSLYAQPDIGGHDELETKDGRTVDRHSAPLYDPAKRYLGRIWFMRDITQRKTAEQTIIELARTDALTGLPNRVAFLDRLAARFRARQARRQAVCGPLSRPRPLQGYQRHARPSGRRRAVEGGRRAAQELRAQNRYGFALRRR